MKRQMAAYKGHDEIAIEGHNIKLGRGGIREIEFFVQTQQLIAGGRHPELRGRETLQTLDDLAAGGWIGREAARDLAEAYRFLRVVEHRLQMVADEQTHTLPAEREGVERFARFLGFAGRDAFAAALLEHMRKVQRQYARLFEDAPAAEASRRALAFPLRQGRYRDARQARRDGLPPPARGQPGGAPLARAASTARSRASSRARISPSWCRC